MSKVSSLNSPTIGLALRTIGNSRRSPAVTEASEFDDDIPLSEVPHRGDIFIPPCGGCSTLDSNMSPSSKPAADAEIATAQPHLATPYGEGRCVV
jgi:hypothetical protein